MSELSQARELLGELFVSGVPGTSLNESARSFLKSKAIGATILFKDNYQNPEQVASFIGEIQECRRELPLWISVDHEGGRVQRFREPFTVVPPAAQLAKKDSPKLIFDLSRAIALELQAVGVNLNYTPVADILTNPSNPVIGDRAWGADEDSVSKFVTAIVRGYLTARVAPCVKHFPGHGDTSVDSHFELPRVDTSAEILLKRELQPFKKGFKSGCPFVMTAHVMVSALDAKVPATLSSLTLNDWLRKECRFEGVIMSDDLQMQAITDHYGMEEAPLLALQAGCDVLIYRTMDACQHAYEALDGYLNSKKLSPARVIEAAHRSIRIKKELLVPYTAPEPKTVLQALANSEAPKILKELMS